jgi:hypothetical protein
MLKVTNSGITCNRTDIWQFNYNAYVFPTVLLIGADVDECNILGICNGICHNTQGSHNCTECPRKTVYDTATRMCISTKEQNLVLGEFYDTINSTY